MFVLGGFALLVFLYGRASHQISSDRAQAAALTAQAQRAQIETGRLAAYTTFDALSAQRINGVAELVDSRFDWAHVFHEFARVLPPQVSVSSLTGAIAGGSAPPAAGAPAGGPSASPSAPAGPTSASPSGSPEAVTVTAPTVTSATPPGSVPSFTLVGCATSQQAVAVMLGRLRLMDGVSSVALQSSTKSTSPTGGLGSGGCTSGRPAYTVQITFDPLPAPAAIRASRAAAASAGPGASTIHSTTATGGAR
jgi:hypothetical protein